MVKYLLLLICLQTVALRKTVFLDKIKETNLTIAFGSCFRIFDLKNAIFEAIGRNEPHLWAWMGDAAYTDNVKKAGCKRSHY